MQINALINFYHAKSLQTWNDGKKHKIGLKRQSSTPLFKPLILLPMNYEWLKSIIFVVMQIWKS